MVDTPTLSPAAARRRLGSELRGLRESARLSLAEAGTPVGRSPATMSRIENGTTTVRLHDVDALLVAYRDAGAGVDDTLSKRLHELVAAGRRKEWFNEYRDVISGDMTDDHVARYISYETYARTFDNYEPELVPGLLQVRRYARAVTDEYFSDHSEHQRERLVDLRLERRRIIEKQRSPHLRFVIGEGTLTRIVGGADTMAEQLAAIAAEIRNGSRHVEIRILPAHLMLPAAVGGPFVVMTFDDQSDESVVYLEGRAGASYLSGDGAIERYAANFDALAAASYPDDEAVNLIEEVVKGLP